MLYTSLVAKRSVPLGPENPDVTTERAVKQIEKITRALQIVNGLAASASGTIVLFIVLVFIWRRSLVDRVSLRIMFAISILDCAANAIQIPPLDRTITASGCRAYRFFLDFCIFTSIYLSSSIAMNLYMVFLRKTKSTVSVLVKRLYFVIPIAVGLLHVMPQYIWAAVHGYCAALDPIDGASLTGKIYVVLALLLLPWGFVMFNVVICTWVIIWLLIKQHQLRLSLEHIRKRRASILNASQAVAFSNGDGLSMIQEYERQLSVRSNVNKGAFRIVLYPLAPLIWCIMMTVHTALLFDVTMTYVSDIDRVVISQKITAFSYPATTLLHFLVFLTDPVMLNVIREVRKSVMAKCSKKSDFAEIESRQGSDVNSVTRLSEPAFAYREYDGESQKTQCTIRQANVGEDFRSGMYSIYENMRGRDRVCSERMLAEM